jgi:Protein of unknown function (DUF1622)
MGSRFSRRWASLAVTSARGAGAASLPVHEVVIIADIVLMITVDRTFDSAITLGIIVLVRTFLSFSLEIELEGALPWRRGWTEKRPDPAVSVGEGPG